MSFFSKMADSNNSYNKTTIDNFPLVEVFFIGVLQLKNMTSRARVNTAKERSDR